MLRFPFDDAIVDEQPLYQYHHHHYHQQQQQQQNDSPDIVNGGDPLLASAAHTLRTAPLYTPIDIELVLGNLRFHWQPYASHLVMPNDETIRMAISLGQLQPWTAVYMSFMHTVPSRTSWWRTQKRRLEHFISGPWHHPEMVFWREPRPGRESLLTTVSVTEERGVDFIDVPGASSFQRSHDIYEMVRLDLTPEQALRAYLFAMVQRGKPFNRFGYYFYYCPPMSWFVGQAVQNEASWTCVQLACQTLIEANPERYGGGVLWPRSTTPTELYCMVTQLGASPVIGMPDE